MTAPLTLQDVLDGTAGEPCGAASPSLRLTSVCTDSRTVEKGALFVAVRGQKHDGHEFVAEAFARGAAAALVEQIPADHVTAAPGEGPPLVLVADTLGAIRAWAAHHLERHPAEVVVVVGGVGIETAAELIAAVLDERYGVIKVNATQHPLLELPLALLKSDSRRTWVVAALNLTQPHQVEYVAQLAGSTTMVVTTLDRPYAADGAALQVKTRLIDQLASRLPRNGTLVLNADDPALQALGTDTAATRIRFGLSPNADVRAEAVVGHGSHGLEVDLVVARRRVRVRLPLYGMEVLHSALAAAAVGVGHGIELREIGAGLQTASPTVRIIVATGVNGSRIIDDSYNASPESTLEALNLLAELDGRKVAVLGDMLDLGSFEVAGHRKVGNRAAHVVDELVTVGERARLMADEARRSGLPASAVVEARSVEAAIPEVRRRLRPGDYVLIKGAAEIRLDSLVRALSVEG
jgi:UDP-N-acetylmuramoyl-tripeptide--D-alanyl-D-alanine ligase